jgi:hypothetical protein
MMAIAGAAMLLLACSENTAPVIPLAGSAGRTTTALLTLDPNPTMVEGPSLDVTTGSSGPVRYKTSFSVIQGRQSDFLLQYVVQGQSTGQTVTQKALVLSIPADAQVVDPAGRTIPRGASVTVNVYIVRDGDRVEATFGPEGLGFNGPQPAEIVTSYRETTDPTAADTWATTSVNQRVVKIRRFSNYAVAF